MSAKQSGLSETYIKSIDQRKKSARYINNNDDRLFIAEQKVIEKLAKSSCVNDFPFLFVIDSRSYFILSPTFDRS